MLSLLCVLSCVCVFGIVVSALHGYAHSGVGVGERAGLVPFCCELNTLAYIPAGLACVGRGTGSEEQVGSTCRHDYDFCSIYVVGCWRCSHALVSVFVL